MNKHYYLWAKLVFVYQRWSCYEPTNVLSFALWEELERLKTCLGSNISNEQVKALCLIKKDMGYFEHRAVQRVIENLNKSEIYFFPNHLIEK